MQALWMLAASLFFATMAVCIKIASEWFNPAELVFWRGALGMVVMAAWARSLRTSLATRYPLMHAWRSLVGVLSLAAWFMPAQAGTRERRTCAAICFFGLVPRRPRRCAVPATARAGGPHSA